MTDSYFLSKWNSLQLHKAKLSFLQNYLLSLHRNREVVEFLDNLLAGIDSISNKMGMLLYCLKILKQYQRTIPKELAESFPEQYDLERETIAEEQTIYDPVKWIEAEIEFISSYSKIQQEFPETEEPVKETKLSEKLYPETKEFLTLKETMDLLKISKSTLDRRREEGLPWHKDGKKLYFKRNELIKWIDKKRW
ncbi:MAG: helix-turn-helix domain-containing protein [Bacteroidetes bacterium]|nr:helix-turn-helix domain-containing protein [Bacteroidota bacterium]HET6245385.1 helix-turn-helix domain-containing protein [Bacteroidia bacterium]